MSGIIELQDLTKTLSKPYITTRSKLGTTTKVIEDRFICSYKELAALYESMGEKVLSFQPSKAGFQFLVSFTDSTHYENSSLANLEKTLSNCSKKTDKLILNWSIGQENDGIEDEMSITVRISNEMNPFVVLQAAMSKDHGEVDKLDFEDGSVSVSINGATQNTAEEIFAIVQRWASACPQPQSVTGFNNTIDTHSGKIEFVNNWVFPTLFIICAFFFLSKLPMDSVQPYSLVAFASFILMRSAVIQFNRQIRSWCSSSKRFNLFMLTGGDSNQQTKIFAQSKNSTVKLFASVTLSFLINIAAGAVVALYITS
jgi:hypothetical protein